MKTQTNNKICGNCGQERNKHKGRYSDWDKIKGFPCKKFTPQKQDKVTQREFVEKLKQIGNKDAHSQERKYQINKVKQGVEGEKQDAHSPVEKGLSRGSHPNSPFESEQDARKGGVFNK